MKIKKQHAYVHAYTAVWAAELGVLLSWRISKTTGPIRHNSVSALQSKVTVPEAAAASVGSSGHTLVSPRKKRGVWQMKDGRFRKMREPRVSH